MNIELVKISKYPKRVRQFFLVFGALWGVVVRHLFVVLLMAAAFLFLSCTNFDIDPVSGRFEDNFSGRLTTPGNIDPAGTNDFTFAVMGDSHIGAPGGKVLSSILDRVVAAGDAFVLLTGDITDTGRDSQYDDLNAMFVEKNVTFRTAIGNHDIFFGGWDSFSKKIGRSIYSFNADNLHVAVIDSANGVLGEGQLRWLERDMATSTAEHKIVISHFPAWNGTFSSIYKMASEEEAAILKDILHRTGVDIMFASHYHGYNETVIGGVKYIVTGGANDIIDIGNGQHFFRVRIRGSVMTTEYIPFP